MNNSDDSVLVSRPDNHPVGGGAIPASSLFFRVGEFEAVAAMVRKHHYSKRFGGSILHVFTLHLGGGLFGSFGDAVCGCAFSSPPTRWSEPVIELCRLVRLPEYKPPLSMLISMSVRWIAKNTSHDLIVSFADKTQGHEGTVYRASGWNYAGARERRMDGLIVDGVFVPGRTCNARFGSRSPDKVRSSMPSLVIEPHYDEGKHLYWKALNKSGEDKASRMGLVSVDWRTK